jgi:hypothetical protein
MKNITPLAFFILFIGCANSNNVFWCGDHACSNKKEKEEYFAKTMIVEIKQKNKKNKKKLSNVEIVEKEYGLNQEEEREIIKNKKISKATQNNQKEQLKREKEIEKQILRDERKKLKKEKKILKENKKLSKKQKVNKENINAKESITTESNDFDDLAKSILEKNKTKSFPDINDIN